MCMWGARVRIKRFGVQVQVLDLKNGSYELHWNAIVAGDYTLHCNLQGKPVPSFPFYPKVPKHACMSVYSCAHMCTVGGVDGGAPR